MVRSEAVALTGTSNGIAAVFGPIFGSAMVTCFGTWKAAFAGSAALGVLTTLLTICFYPHPKTADGALVESGPDHGLCSRIRRNFAESLSAYPALLRNPRFLSFTLSDFFVHGPVYVWSWGAPYLLVNYFGYTTLQQGLIFSCAWGIPLTIGSIITPAAYRYLGETRTYIVMSCVVIALNASLAVLGWYASSDDLLAELEETGEIQDSSPYYRICSIVLVSIVPVMFVAWGVVINAMYDLGPRAAGTECATPRLPLLSIAVRISLSLSTPYCSSAQLYTLSLSLPFHRPHTPPRHEGTRRRRWASSSSCSQPARSQLPSFSSSTLSAPRIRFASV